MRFAFEIAQKRPRKHLTVVTKSNAQRNGMVLWDEVAADVAKEFPDVTVEKMLVDAMTTKMVLKPESIDTIVASNLVSGILTYIGRVSLTDTTARGHPLRLGRRSRWLYWHRTHQQSRPQPREPPHVRAHPRLCL
jgi:hypothetical protein